MCLLCNQDVYDQNVSFNLGDHCLQLNVMDGYIRANKVIILEEGTYL